MHFSSVHPTHTHTPVREQRWRITVKQLLPCQRLRVVHQMLIQRYHSLFWISLGISFNLMWLIDCCIYFLFGWHLGCWALIAVVCSAIPRQRLSIKRCGLHGGGNSTDCRSVSSLSWGPSSMSLQPFWLSCCPIPLTVYLASCYAC